MRERQRIARAAGLLYLPTSVTSAFSLGSIPSWSVGATDASAVVRKIVDAPRQYRLGAVSELASQVFFVVLVLALFTLLEEVHRGSRPGDGCAWPGSGADGVRESAAWPGSPGSSERCKLSVGVQQGTAGRPHLVALNARGYGVKAVMVFWGLWLLPFGMLVYRSGSLPKALGVLLLAGCLVHVVVGVTSLLMPSLERAVAPLTALAVGEILICLWLLIKGARPESLDQHSPHKAGD